ncbi:MAG: hypothetical protein QXI32_01830 [Candidatus Bathyarchaeia archaeon]
MTNSFYRVAAMTIVLMLLGATGVTITSLVHANGQAGTTLSATVSVTPHWTITYGWTIDKSVNPASWAFYPGGSGTSTYTITLTKDSGTEEAWVEGQVCVTNGGAVATENLAITVLLRDGYGPPNDYLTEAPVDVSSNPVLNPGETGCYNYRVNIPITGGDFPQPHAGGTYKVTADVTITNHSGHLGERFGPSPSATTTFPSSPTLVNNVINVDDTNGGSWTFSASGSVTYDKIFTCDDEGENINTATIRETGQSDDAVVTVTCMEEEKEIKYYYETAYAYSTNATSFIPTFRNWGWTIQLGKEGTYTFDVYAGAGQCDITKGMLVGTVEVTYSGGTVTVNFDLGSNDVADFTLEEFHVYAGYKLFPTFKGKPTVAPGQYTVGTGLSGPIYVIVHAVVGIPYYA